MSIIYLFIYLLLFTHIKTHLIIWEVLFHRSLIVWCRFSNVSCIVILQQEEHVVFLYQCLSCTGAARCRTLPQLRGSNPGQVSTMGLSWLTQVSERQFRMNWVCVSISVFWLWSKARLWDCAVILTAFIYDPFILIFKSDCNKVRWNRQEGLVWKSAASEAPLCSLLPALHKEIKSNRAIHLIKYQSSFVWGKLSDLQVWA